MIKWLNNFEWDVNIPFTDKVIVIFRNQCSWFYYYEDHWDGVEFKNGGFLFLAFNIMDRCAYEYFKD